MLRKLTMWIVALTISANAFACGDYCGLYNTGGYNLLDVSINISTGLDYAYTSSGSSNWGGGCGSFLSSCNSAWDSAGLYGSSWSAGYTPSIGISINLDTCLNPLLTGGGYGLDGLGYGSGIYGDIGCAIGYCGNSSVMPYDPSLLFLDPSIFGGAYSYPVSGIFPGSFPPWLFPTTYPSPQLPTVYMNFPTTVPNVFNGQFPSPTLPSGSGIFTTPTSTIPSIGSSTLPFSLPPASNPPPYGACDDVFVPCPMGPVTRTNQPIPGMPTSNYLPPSPTLPGTPNNPLAPTSHTGQIDPNRGRIPRGAFFR